MESLGKIAESGEKLLLFDVLDDGIVPPGGCSVYPLSPLGDRNGRIGESVRWRAAGLKLDPFGACVFPCVKGEPKIVRLPPLLVNPVSYTHLTLPTIYSV